MKDDDDRWDLLQYLFYWMMIVIVSMHLSLLLWKHRIIDEEAVHRFLVTLGR